MKKIVAIILAVACVSAAMSQLPPIIQRSHRQTIMPGVMRELNLTPGQRMEIKGIRQRANANKPCATPTARPPSSGPKPSKFAAVPDRKSAKS